MTNEDRWKRYWKAVEGEFAIVPKSVWESKSEARAAFLAAAPPDDVRQACIEALESLEDDNATWAKEHDGYASEEYAEERDRYAVARKWLEGE